MSSWHPSWGTTADLTYAVLVSCGVCLPFIYFLGLVLIGTVTLPSRSPNKGAGRRLFGPFVIGFYYWMLTPLLRLVMRTSLTPNQFTGAALVTGAVAAVAIATGHFILASALLVISATMDIVDGELARLKKLTGPVGAFLDSTLDRICDGMIFGGCVVYYAGTPIMYVALVVLIMSFTVSYARSRGEALGLSGAEGLMQRADRIVVLCIVLAFAPLFGHRMEGFVAHPFYGLTAYGLCLLAVLNTATAISRIVWTVRQLRGRNGPSVPAIRDAVHIPNLIAPTAETAVTLNQPGQHSA